MGNAKGGGANDDIVANDHDFEDDKIKSWLNIDLLTR